MILGKDHVGGIVVALVDGVLGVCGVHGDFTLGF